METIDPKELERIESQIAGFEHISFSFRRYDIRSFARNSTIAEHLHLQTTVIEPLRKELASAVNNYLDQRALNQNLASQIAELQKEVERLRQWKDSVDSLKVGEELEAMINSSKALYETIMDTPGFAFHFNNICNIAQRKATPPTL